MLAQSSSKAPYQPALFNYSRAIPQSTAGSRGLKEGSQPLYLKPQGTSHHGREGYYFNIVCGFNHKIFGGLYSLAEAEEILKSFEHCRHQITPREFGVIAERVIAATNAGRVAA